MGLCSFDELFAAADARRPRAPVVAAGGGDETVLTALAEAHRRGWVEPLLTGDMEAIRAAAAAAQVDLAPFKVLATDAQPAAAAVAAVREGRGRLLMKGQVSTPELMKAVLDRERGLRTGEAICQMVLMEVVPHARRFLLADTGVTIAPTLAQKQSMVRSLVEAARRLGAEAPRIAIVSATEKPTAAMPDTLEAVELVRWAQTGAAGNAVVDGPLSFDLAYDVRAAQRKGVQSEVVGRAEGMLFPNLLAANLTVKAMMYTADCRFGGVLAGAARPVVFMSRADDVPTRLRSLALALAMEAAAGG
jgi:phosphotransacetylase